MIRSHLRPARPLTFPTLATAVVFAIAALGGVVNASTVQAAPREDAQDASCVLIDTDADIDDFRAMPAVIANRDVRAIVVTGGAADARQGATAVAKLFATPGQTSIPVIVGASAIDSPLSSAPWLQPIREAMATANGYLSGPTLAADYTRRGLISGVRDALRGCTSAEVLIIGPFTSFVRYSPKVREVISSVVMQGKPIEGDPTQRPGSTSFNCGYDEASCRTAFSQLRGLRPAWVDVPRGVTPAYQPTMASVDELRQEGMPGALRTALKTTLWTWEPGSLSPGNASLLWDDSAAIFLLDREGYARVGGHWEPTISPEELRQRWVRAVNAVSSTR